MDRPTTTEEIIRLKQEIIRVTPNSGANLNGKDVIFVMKSPGVDAYIFTKDGTVVRRDGWGVKKGLRQYGDFKKSYETLTREGYRPYGVFAPGVRERYEQQHKDAKEKIEKSQDFFPFAPKVTFGKSTDRLGYNQVAIAQPSFYESPRQMGSRVRPTTQNNNDSDYAKLFENMADINKLTQQRVVNRPVMDINQFAAWNNKMYGAVLRRRNQLFKNAPKDKNSGGGKVPKDNISPAELKAKLASARFNAALKEKRRAEQAEGITE